MKYFFPIHQKTAPHPFKKGDLLVLFGELFNRGYANGLVEEAEKNGLTVVRATVGRRDAEGFHCSQFQGVGVSSGSDRHRRRRRCGC